MIAQQRMTVREGASRPAVEVSRRLQRIDHFDEAPRLGPAHTTPGEHHGSLAMGKRSDHLIERARIDPTRLGRPISSRPTDGGLLHHVELDIHRDVEEHRRPPAGEGVARRDGDVVGQPLHLPAGPRPGGDGAEQPRVVHLLEPALELLAKQMAAAEKQQRRL